MAAFLDEISRRCKRLDGRHLDKTQILRALLSALMDLEGRVDWQGIRDEEALHVRLKKAFSPKK